MSVTEYRSACAYIALMAPVLIRLCSGRHPTVSTTTAFLQARNFFGARPVQSSGTSNKVTLMSTWTCGAVAGPAAGSNFSVAPSSRIFTTPLNGSAGNPGAAARLAALASPIFACCNGLWRRWRRRHWPASPRMTAWPIFIVPESITAESPAISSPVTGGIRTASSTAFRPAVRRAIRKPI